MGKELEKVNWYVILILTHLIPLGPFVPQKKKKNGNDSVLLPFLSQSTVFVTLFSFSQYLLLLLFRELY